MHKYQTFGQRDALHTPPMSHSSAIGSQKTIVVDDEPALDLRNTSTKTSASSSLGTTTTQVRIFSIPIFINRLSVVIHLLMSNFDVSRYLF